MPQTINPFYRGDVVLVCASLFRPGTTQDARTWFVNYPASPGRDEMQLCTSMNGGGMWEYFPVDKVTLLRRGNYFRYQFATPLSFPSLADEAIFWLEKGKMHELRNPADYLYYTWTLEQAIAALQQGTAHAFLYSTGHVELITGKPSFGGYTVDVPEVAERMRAHCLAELLSLPAQALPV